MVEEKDSEAQYMAGSDRQGPADYVESGDSLEETNSNEQSDSNKYALDNVSNGQAAEESSPQEQ